MTILLTGATGFLGSHLLKALCNKKYDVVVLKRSVSDTSRISQVMQRCKVYDIDRIAESDVFSRERIDVVIHCATVYGRGGKDTSEVVEGNICFPLRLLEAAIQAGCKYFINTDSFFCKQIPHRMENNLPLYMPDYTLSKHQFLAWGRNRAAEGKITFVNLRMEHIYGPDDSPGKFIPWLEKQLRENARYVDLTDGRQQRDFIHVDDVVKVYLHLLENLDRFSGYHYFEVGTGRAVSLRSFVENLKEQLDSKTELRFGEIPRKDTEIMYSVAEEAHRYTCD